MLEVYERPYDPQQPVVCLDEKNKQLLKDIRTPRRVTSERPTRIDYEYERNGTCNLFVAVEPKGQRRTIRVTRRRTKKDYASLVKYLVDGMYKDASKIVLVEDNLNTHTRQTLIDELGEQEGKRIEAKIERHHTPTHASWLNQAEIEIAAVERQCLARRIPDFHTMQSEVAACVRRRNKDRCGITWQFTREKAIRKFKLS